MRTAGIALFGVIWFGALAAQATEPIVDSAAAKHGYQNLVNKAYLPPDFDQATFDAAWKHWPSSVMG
jgi:hypothetical protein